MKIHIMFFLIERKVRLDAWGRNSIANQRKSCVLADAVKNPHLTGRVGIFYATEYILQFLEHDLTKLL